jgi:hypothetical protein
MKNALISSEEKVYKYDGSYLGLRVAEISGTAFEVAPTLFWITCADDVLADQFYYDETAQTCVSIPLNPAIKLIPSQPTGGAPDVVA